MASFKNAWDVVDAVQISTNVSPDGRATSVLCRNLEVSIGGDTEHGPLVRTRAASFRVPVEGVNAPVSVRQIIRGFAEIHIGSQAVLVAQLCGKTVMVPLPTPGSKGDNFRHEVESTLSPSGFYQATFFLLAECNSNTDSPGVHLQIDAFDLEFSSPAKGKA